MNQPIESLQTYLQIVHNILQGMDHSQKWDMGGQIFSQRKDGEWGGFPTLYL